MNNKYMNLWIEKEKRKKKSRVKYVFRSVTVATFHIEAIFREHIFFVLFWFVLTFYFNIKNTTLFYSNLIFKFTHFCVNLSAYIIHYISFQYIGHVKSYIITTTTTTTVGGSYWNVQLSLIELKIYHGMWWSLGWGWGDVFFFFFFFCSWKRKLYLVGVDK